MAAALRDEHGCPIVLTDEHGCPVELSDEFGNPKQLLGVATAGPPTLGTLLRADAALDSDPAVVAAVTGGLGPDEGAGGGGAGGQEQLGKEGRALRDELNDDVLKHDKGHVHEHEHVSFMEKIKRKLPGGGGHHV